ncbi:MAG: phenylacetate--CoA ligase family protein [Muribaculaceae bacterium]|nr:phenylacetate--CoA ligase family protein [Muribaculaceae bacterium]
MNIRIKEFIRDIAKFTPQYHATYKDLSEEFTVSKLTRKIKQAILDVPYYRNNDYKSYLPHDDKDFSIHAFPILTKDDISGKEKDFVSDKFYKFLLRSENTGGTTGKPLKLYYSPTLSFSRTVYPDILYKKYVGKPLQLALLRGTKPSDGKLVERVGMHRIVLSSYQLYPENVDKYIKAINDEGITCLLVYPSSITVLAQLIKSKYGKVSLPKLKAILASSEIFSKSDKKLVMDVFQGVTLIDFYCMSEFAAAAHSIGLGNYEFNYNYGYVEFVDTGEKTVSGNKICKIISTCLMNSTMPLIRYDTSDMAEIDSEGNVVSIIGRTSDFILNKNNDLMPCIITPRDRSFENVVAFQYYQPKPGMLEFHVMVNDRFNEEDFNYLSQDVEETFPHRLIDSKVVVKKELKKTKQGKLLRLVRE